MSYDRAYICHGIDRQSWTEKREAEKAGRGAEFSAEGKVLYEKGSFVVLNAGANCCFDELYLFDNPAHAKEFFGSVSISRESVLRGIPAGFQDIALHIKGRLVARKELSATEVVDPDCFVIDESTERLLEPMDEPTSDGSNSFDLYLNEEKPMNVVMEYKLDEEADNTIWIGEDKALHVMLDTDGIWKIKDKTPIIKEDIHILYNSRHDVTDEQLGKLMIEHWHKVGCPRLQEIPRTSTEYYEAMPWAPKEIVDRYQRYVAKRDEQASF